MRNFDDFLKSVNISKVAKANSQCEINTENIFATMSEMSVSASVEILRQYHEWLSQEQN